MDAHDSTLSRRGFLSALVSSGAAWEWARAWGPAANAAGARPPGAAGDPERNLVVIQLVGGNDGLSTVVPYGDDAYAKNRRQLAIDPLRLLPLDDYRGLHPELVNLRGMYEDGHLGIVEGVGLPLANLSHFKAFEVWHSADLRGRAGGDGWIGRLCDALDPDGTRSLLSIHVGKRAPYSLYSSNRLATVFEVPERYRWFAGSEFLETYAAQVDAGARHENESLGRLRGILRGALDSSARLQDGVARYRTLVEYPATQFGRDLHTIAALIGEQVGARIFSLELGNFDTHHYQPYYHDKLMEVLDEGLAAFFVDLTRSEAGQNTLVLLFSEFGRRVEENDSGGTDHGTAGPAFVLGHRVRGGLHGSHPSLTELVDDNLQVTVDFRAVYATLVESWLGIPHATVLGSPFPLVPFVAS